MSSVALEQENKDLIQKLARIQEERSILEEKVRHLESSNSAMASDLIQQYSSGQRGSISGRFLLAAPSIDSRVFVRLGANARISTPPSRRRPTASTDRQSGTSLNLRNMFENLSGNRHQTSNDETIKNLQRMLEETLTKNMHLQKDLESMSLQLQSQPAGKHEHA